MHQERFIILRDNIENGPFSLDELIRFSLLPKDLVWVEGKSNGWVHPTEISTLKQYVKETTEKQHENLVVDEETEPQNKLKEQKASENAMHIYVSMPNTNKVVVINQKISLADKLERKAQEIYKRVQAYNQQKTTQPIDAPKQFGVHTLNDLRKQYADWKIAKSKEKRYKYMFRAITLAGVLLLLVATYFTWLRSKNEKVFLNDEVIRYSASPLSKGALDVEAETENILPHINNHEDVDIPKHEVGAEVTDVDAFLDSVKNILSQQGNIKLNIKKNMPPKNKAKGALSTSKTDTSLPDNNLHLFQSTTQNAAEVSRVPTANELKNSTSISTSHQFNKDANTLKDLSVTVHNHSAEHIVNISVNVFYYKLNGKLIGKETLHFSNVSANDSSTLAARVSKKAVTAKCKINTVSHSNLK